MSHLTFRYEPDPNDDVGRLWLSLQTAHFTGTGFFYSYRNGLLEFAEGLRNYPLAKPLAWKTGYGDAAAKDAILRVQIEPVGPLGHLSAEVEIADLHDPSIRVNAKFETSYEAVAELRKQLIALSEGRTDEAVLSRV